MVSLLTEPERHELNLGWLQALHLPIEDRGLPPDRARVQQVARQVATDLKAGKSILIHCCAGIGRTGMIAGCVLAELGHRPTQAILDLLTKARGVEVPDTPEQADWLADYVRSLDAPTSLEDAFRRL